MRPAASNLKLNSTMNEVLWCLPKTRQNYNEISQSRRFEAKIACVKLRKQERAEMKYSNGGDVTAFTTDFYGFDFGF